MRFIYNVLNTLFSHNAVKKIVLLMIVNNVNLRVEKLRRTSEFKLFITDYYY